VIVLAGVALRLYFSIRLRPSLIGFPDSGVYILAAHGQPFENSLREAGYSLFLRFMHSLWPHLVLVIWVQHLLGLFSGLLLYGTVRRAGLPRALGLIPAAIVILSGDEIFIEHAPLTESLFVFLVVLGLYALVRAWRGNWWWAAPAGLSLGAAVDIRSLGLVLAAMLVVVAALIYVGTWRGRLLRVALTVLGVAVPIAAYLIAHQAATGQAVLTTAGNFNLYGRVAPFADCSRFTPPAGTRDLCITVPVNRRPGPSAWLFSGASPAVRAYGEPDFSRAKPDENARLQAFSEAAILGQPGAYLEYVGRDLVRLVDPSFPSSPYGNRGVTGLGYGQTPEQLTDYYFDDSTGQGVAGAIAGYYHDPIIEHNIDPLITYEHDTRIEGPLMAVLLALALLSPIAATGHRRAAFLFLTATVVLLAGPPFLVDYDYRYTIPAFGVLGCSAAAGVWGVCFQIRRLASRRSTTRLAGRPAASQGD
jgi:hypothetical protein